MKNFLKIFHVTPTIYEFTLRDIITKHTKKGKKLQKTKKFKILKNLTKKIFLSAIIK